MELTAEQQAIIEAGATDLVVIAGAGSGKTHVLVERYLRLLASCRIPEIAAVTFTEAAATEMRERVRRAVMTDPALSDDRRDMDEAAIGTVHALALRLLCEHPVEAAIDPAADVLADDEAELLRRIACAEAIDAAAEAGDARTAALRAIEVYHAGLQLPLMVARRDDVRAAFAAMGPEPDGWAEHARATLDARYGALREPLRAEVAEIAAEMARDIPAANEGLATIAREVLGELGDPASGEWSGFVGRLAEARARTDLRRGSRSASPDVEIKAGFVRLRELDDEAGKLPAWNEHDGPALAALVGLRDLFEDADARYAAAKRERHALDFLDLELGAIRLLRDHPDVAAEVRAGFRHLMVDEAQDINPAQAELVALIAGDDGNDGAEPRPHLFLVGDAKQSIYHFRGADVQRFGELRALATGRGGPSLPLSQSFRAHDALVDRLNELFGSVFANPSEPFDAVMESMKGRPSPPPGEAPHLVLMPVGRTTPNGDRAGGDERRRVEADAVASEIAALLRDQRPIYDREVAATRPVTPGDVAVLLRRFSNVHTFEEALEAHDVPYTTPSGTGFFTRQEVLDCGHLLRWLAEPHDDIALVGVLRSPFFVLADDTLLALRSTGRPLLRTLADPPAAISGDERARCEHAGGVLGELRSAAGSASAETLLELALDRTAVEAAWVPIGGGEQARANIRKLVRIARTLAGHSLTEVVEYLEQRRDDLDAREGPAVLDRTDAVQLMTVHASKGLEFPIVFVPEAHLIARGSYPAVRWRRGDGVSATMARDEDDETRPKPGFYAHLQRQDDREEAAEHRRLFYVAATRAADYLYVSGDDAGGECWLGMVRDAHASGALRNVEMRAALPVDVDAIARRSHPPEVQVPAAADEEDYVPPLLARPRVIPIRASTPVTALRARDDTRSPVAYGDGLGAVRGRLVHRALELAHGPARATLDGAALEAIAREESDRALDASTVAALAADAVRMLELFEGSPTAAALHTPGIERWFELPFAWDWDGIPVHGSIDLVYRDEAGWHVIDFKTDSLNGTTAAAVTRGYLVQIGLYQRALAAAVGDAPAAGLLFLRSGELVEPDAAGIDAALIEGRARVDAGAPLDSAAEELPSSD